MAESNSASSATSMASTANQPHPLNPQP